MRDQYIRGIEELQPIINQFFGFLKKGKLMGFKCGDCGFVLLPPRGVCCRCGGFHLSWVPLSGKGELLFASVGTHGLTGVKFVQGTIELEEGPIIPGMVLIDSFDFSKPEKIWEYNQAGIPVIAEIKKNPMGVEGIIFKINVKSPKDQNPSSQI